MSEAIRLGKCGAGGLAGFAMSNLVMVLNGPNHEGHLIDWMHEAQAVGARAILINAGAYTHTSIALHDAAKSIKVPCIDVHLSDPMKREAFRHVSYIGMACVAEFRGHGPQSYVMALEHAAGL